MKSRQSIASAHRPSLGLPALGLWLGLALATAARAAEDGGATSAVLERGNGPEPSTLDAHRCPEVACGNVLRDLYEGLVAEDARSNGEFFCVVERVGEDQRDEMTVMVEVPDLQSNGAAVKADLERRLKEVIGVRVTVQPAAKGDLDPYTGTTQTTKLKRLLDKRKV